MAERMVEMSANFLMSARPENDAQYAGNYPNARGVAKKRDANIMAAVMSLRGSSEAKNDIGTTNDDITQTGSSEHKTGSFGVMERNVRRGGSRGGSLIAAMMIARESNEKNDAEGSFGEK